MARQTASSTMTATSDVNKFLQHLEHPLLDVMIALRQIILNTDKAIGEEIKWNAPAFFYTGEMKAFDPKTYSRHIVVFNFHKKDCIRLIFPTGAKVKDGEGLLEGSYTDGRKIATIYDMSELKAKEKALQKVIKEWLKLVDK
jgi:hypothetical protein